MADNRDIKIRSLTEDIKSALIGIEDERKSGIERLLLSVMRDLRRLSTYSDEYRNELGKFAIDFQNLISGEKGFQKLNEGKSSEEAFGESFLKSFNILKKELLPLLEKIS